MKILLVALLVIHALVQLLSAADAFHFAHFEHVPRPVSRREGVSWLLSSLLFLVTAVLILTGSSAWWILAVLAVVLSQFLIFRTWRTAKLGTILNVVILI